MAMKFLHGFSGKRRHITLGVVGLAVIAALVALGVYFAVFYVSKADYRAAAIQTNTVITDYNELLVAADAYTASAADDGTSATDMTSTQNAFTKALATYHDSVDQLSGQRALRDGSVDHAYRAFATRNGPFVDNITTLTTTMPVLHTVATNCSEDAVSSMDTGDLGKLVAAYDKAITPCVDSMKQLSNSPDPTAAKVGTSAVEYFAAVRGYVVKMQAAYKANDRPTFQKNYSAFMDKAADFAKATDLTSITGRQSSLAPTDELNALAHTITTRY